MFQVSNHIGHGACGDVYVALNKKTQNEVAIKFVEMQKKWKQRAFTREVQNLRKLSNCNGVINLHDAIIHDKVGMIITEVFDFDLYYYLQTNTISNEEKKNLFYKICYAVRQCHQNYIAHLDIKPGNVLIKKKNDELVVKLCDFGSSYKWSIDNTICSRSTGTSNYQAPEVINGNDYIASAADIWELGVLLHIILTNQFPYDANDKSNLKISEGISPDALDLINLLLTYNPESRPSIEEVLHHEFFTGPPKKQTEEPEGSLLSNSMEKTAPNQNRVTILQRTLSIVKLFSTKKQKKKKNLLDSTDAPRKCEKTNSV